jgi:hypothetical protein
MKLAYHTWSPCEAFQTKTLPPRCFAPACGYKHGLQKLASAEEQQRRRNSSHLSSALKQLKIPVLFWP